ncbi:hypothetical protein AXF42_Ash021186 [Apostasia shenzhenica]|uniref:Uncharacterized protein n=1 Tax=Apostasia shenzhenica TaxID=1088818 RepID=A0A2I0AA52_9ASPA|nr:hypothetical protein AXF42_Ash021186 [Apostasia shenzhenica]
MGNPHNDPIAVTARVADFDVWRVLLDSRSAADILFKSAFLQMGLKETNLLHAGTTLMGFSGERVQPLGFISLSISFCDDNDHTMSMVNFAVIRARSGYNAILGRTTLNSFGMVISIPHLCAKFPTSSDVVTIRGDLRQTTRCFPNCNTVHCRLSGPERVSASHASGRGYQCISGGRGILKNYKHISFHECKPASRCHCFAF